MPDACFPAVWQSLLNNGKENEVVVAMDLKTGKDVWTQVYPGHFKEDLGGNGPRATPTIAGNEVFALGANGLLVCLDLASGEQKWQTIS